MHITVEVTMEHSTSNTAISLEDLGTKTGIHVPDASLRAVMARKSLQKDSRHRNELDNRHIAHEDR